MYNDPAVLAQITALQSMNIDQLRAKWCELNKREPSKTSSCQYLRKHLTYRIQVLAYGGDTAETEARLAAAVRQYGIDQPGRKGKRKHVVKLPAAGTILTREYHGVEHQVQVLGEGGFQYQGCRYRSLSAIARLITGMSWNGPSFFGLREKSGKQA